jgi:hypothetical protein
MYSSLRLEESLQRYLRSASKQRIALMHTMCGQDSDLQGTVRFVVSTATYVTLLGDARVLVHLNTL